MLHYCTTIPPSASFFDRQGMTFCLKERLFLCCNVAVEFAQFQPYLGLSLSF
jgi:hypothetical protein